MPLPVRSLFVCCAFFGGILSQAWAVPFLPNDFYYRAPQNLQWYSTKMHLEDAWSVTLGDPTLKVAILDTGVISTTPDLTSRVLPALSTAVAGLGSPTIFPPFTDAQLAAGNTSIRHGTYVASVLAMQINNNIGGAGVGNFLIQPIRITNDTAQTNAQSIANGIRLAADQGCKIINVSYTLGDPGIVADAADYARSKGSLVFVGAGNSNRLETIADYPSLIFIGGTNPNDERWVQSTNNGSSFGNFVDFVAPAQNIVAADPPLAPNGYALLSGGTSFSTPLAAGVAGLIWSVNPNLTPDQVEQILRDSAVDLGAPGRDQFFGHGRIDAGAAVALAVASIPEPGTIMVGIAGMTWLVWRRRRVSSAHSVCG
ncbi:MAG: S8 family serine peptidase [Pirellulales bacterium]|nr:S8 family serine peptidase [Pirellulales bacterium]